MRKKREKSLRKRGIVDVEGWKVGTWKRMETVRENGRGWGQGWRRGPWREKLG